MHWLLYRIILPVSSRTGSSTKAAGAGNQSKRLAYLLITAYEPPPCQAYTRTTINRCWLPVGAKIVMSTRRLHRLVCVSNDKNKCSGLCQRHDSFEYIDPLPRFKRETSSWWCHRSQRANEGQHSYRGSYLTTSLQAKCKIYFSLM